MTSLTRQSTFVFGCKLSSALVGVGYYYLVATLIPTVQFGLLMLALSVSLITTAIIKQGMEQLIVRHTANQTGPAVLSLYQTAHWYYGSIAALFILIVWVLGDYIALSLLRQPGLTEMLSWLLLLIASQTLLAINRSSLKGAGYPVESALFSGLITVLTATIATVYIEPESATEALMLYAYSSVLALIMSYLLVYRCKRDIHTNTTSIGFSKLFSSNINFAAITLAAVLTQQLATVVLGRAGSLVEVGVFALALKISNLMGFVLISMNTVTAPHYAKKHASGDIQSFRYLGNKTRKYLFYIGTVLTILLFFAMPFVTRQLDDNLHQLTDIVWILIIGQWFNLATGSVVTMLTMSGHEAIHRRNVIYLALCHMLAVIILVPNYGILAAAWITTVMMIIKNLVSWFYVNRLVLSESHTQG